MLMYQNKANINIETSLRVTTETFLSMKSSRFSGLDIEPSQQLYVDEKIPCIIHSSNRYWIDLLLFS